MRLGIYQAEAGVCEPGERLSQIENCLEAADLDLLLCPELFLSGYAPGEALTRLSEPQDGSFGRQVADTARRIGTAICYGYPEAADGQLFNSAALYDAEGHLLANHRKQLPSPGSFEEEAFGRGRGVTFAELGGWRLAIIICYEVEFPETLRRAAREGAQLVLVPTALGADWGIVAEKVVPARAFENGVWMAYADQCGAAEGFAFFGGSRIVGPDGREAALAGDRPELITATLDRAAVERMQARLPYLRDCRAL